jgi:hypothetical protein
MCGTPVLSNRRCRASPNADRRASNAHPVGSKAYPGKPLHRAKGGRTCPLFQGQCNGPRSLNPIQQKLSVFAFASGETSKMLAAAAFGLMMPIAFMAQHHAPPDQN